MLIFFLGDPSARIVQVSVGSIAKERGCQMSSSYEVMYCCQFHGY